MPAVDCDLDHTVPWADGGRTRCDNLAPSAGTITGSITVAGATW